MSSLPDRIREFLRGTGLVGSLPNGASKAGLFPGVKTLYKSSENLKRFRLSDSLSNEDNGMNLQSSVFGVGLVLLGLFLLFTDSVHGQSSKDKNIFDPRNTNSNYLEEYERQLNAILKTRRDEEKEFVAQVIQKVKEEKIPTYLVDTSFQWVRNRRPDTDYPFIYFERVLRIQAESLNLQDEIPPFDLAIYDQSAGQRRAGQQLNAGRPTESQRESFFARFVRLFRWPRNLMDL